MACIVVGVSHQPILLAHVSSPREMQTAPASISPHFPPTLLCASLLLSCHCSIPCLIHLQNFINYSSSLIYFNYNYAKPITDTKKISIILPVIFFYITNLITSNYISKENEKYFYIYLESITSQE